MARNSEPLRKQPPLVLLVDDDDGILKMLSHALKRHNYRVEATESADEALQWVAAKRYDAAIIDLVMPDHDGLALASAFRKHTPGLPIAIFTGYVHSPLIEDAQRVGVTVIKKPIATQDIVDFIETSL